MQKHIYIYPKKCNKKGNVLKKNLNQQQQQGLQSLSRRVNEKEVIVQKTDEGGNLTLNTPENYIETMKPQSDSDPNLSWEDHAKLEAEHLKCTHNTVCKSAKSGGQMGRLDESEKRRHITSLSSLAGDPIDCLPMNCLLVGNP